MHLVFSKSKFLLLAVLVLSMPAVGQFDSKIQRYRIKFAKSKRPKFTRILVKAQISDFQTIRVDLDHLIFSYRKNKKKTRRLTKYFFEKKKFIGPQLPEEVTEFDSETVEYVNRPVLKIGKLGQLSLIVEGPRKKGILRVPIEIVSTDKSIFRYWLNIVLDEKPYRISITHRETEKSEKRLAEEKLAEEKKEEAIASGESVVDYSRVGSRMGTWFGLGVNHLDFQQKNSSPTSNSKFQSFLIGSLFLDGQFNISQEWVIRGEYKVSPGQIKSKGAKLAGNGRYSWTTISTELLFINRDGTFNMLGLKFMPTFRVGAQNHVVPFLVSADKGGGNIIIEKLRTIGMTNASFGGGFTCKGAWAPTFEVFMRYQYTMLSDKGFTVSPSFTFDGSMGMFLPYKSGLKIGVFWYGQLHTFHYLYTGSSKPIKPTGTQQLFYTNLDFRIGYDF